MATATAATALLTFLLLLFELTLADPHDGDVGVDGDGLVKILMNSQWGTLNGLNYGPSVANTLCRQLGYEDGAIATSPGSNDFPVLLHDIHCPVKHKAKHILRCNYSMNSLDSPMDHSLDIHLTCGSNSTRNPEMDSDQNTYIGQVALVPPYSLNQSSSFGAITIKHYSGRWDFIRNDNKSLLTLKDTDTICREMGYTHSIPNSLQTVGSLPYNFKLSTFGQIPSSQFSCSRSCQCAGCCVNLANRGEDVAVDMSSAIHSALYIECTFYIPVSPSTPPVTGGYREICEASPKDGTIKDEGVCSSDVRTLTNKEFIATIATPIAFAVIVVIGAVTAIIGISVYCKKKRDEYAQLNNHAGGGD